MSRGNRTSRFSNAALVLILLVGFAIRAYHLDFQSLWSDEGISVQRSSQALGHLLATMPVEQLPGYFVLLHGWLAIAGDQDFALRFFSLWPSVLVIALVYRLARDLGDGRSGLIGALLLATNAFQLWYAQELRTYSWLLLTGLVANWSLWHILYGQSRRGWFAALYALATILTVYQHFYGFLLPLVHTLYVAGWWLSHRQWQPVLRWALAGGVTLLGFLPWLPRAVQIFGYSGWRDPIDPGTLPWRYLAAYTVGDSMPAPWHDWLAWLYLLLILAGLVQWWRQRPAASLFLASQALLPLLAVFLWTLRKPDTHERYTIFVSAPLLLLAAGGFTVNPTFKSSRPTTQRWRELFNGLTLIVLALLVGANGAAIYQHYTNSALQKPDYRAAAQHIQGAEEPGDVILVDGPDPTIVFLHYYKGKLPVYDLRNLAEADFEKVDKRLTEVTQGAPRAWEVLFFHEPASIQFWLATRGWTSPPTEYNGIRITLYGLPSQPLAEQAVNIPFGPALVLQRIAVIPTPVRVGDLIRVSTYWQALQKVPEFKFSLRLQDNQGQLLQAQDYVPQNWFTPTSGWPVGQVMVDQRSILAPLDLAAGRYRVTLRLYDPSNGVAIDTPAGQDVVLGEVEIIR